MWFILLIKIVDKDIPVDIRISSFNWVIYNFRAIISLVKVNNPFHDSSREYSSIIRRMSSHSRIIHVLMLLCVDENSR